MLTSSGQKVFNPNSTFVFGYLVFKQIQQQECPSFSPAAEEGNPALLDKLFFFTDYFSLGYVQ